MRVLYHRRNYWHLSMNFIYFKCNENRIIRMFQGWKYNCVNNNGIINICLWR